MRPRGERQKGQMLTGVFFVQVPTALTIAPLRSLIGHHEEDTSDRRNRQTRRKSRRGKQPRAEEMGHRGETETSRTQFTYSTAFSRIIACPTLGSDYPLPYC